MGQIDGSLVASAALYGIVAMAVLGFEHYFPWKRIFQDDLPRPAAYTLGLLALIGAYAGWAWGLECITGATAVAAFCTITVEGGAAVLACYGLDAALDRRNADEQAQSWRRKAIDGPRDDPDA